MWGWEDLSRNNDSTFAFAWCFPDKLIRHPFPKIPPTFARKKKSACTSDSRVHTRQVIIFLFKTKLLKIMQTNQIDHNKRLTTNSQIAIYCRKLQSEISVDDFRTIWNWDIFGRLRKSSGHLRKLLKPTI